jgi:hypothetical protein
MYNVAIRKQIRELLTNERSVWKEPVTASAKCNEKTTLWPRSDDIGHIYLYNLQTAVIKEEDIYQRSLKSCLIY